MALGLQNKEYLKYYPLWEKVRDCVAGEDTIKQKCTLYLPRPNGMDNDDYYAYVTRSEFCNFTNRSLQGLNGLLFRLDPHINISNKYDKYLENVDCKGNNLIQFIRDSAEDDLQTGWGGILVDVPQTSDELSVKEAEENDIYSYMVKYRAEDIEDWDFSPKGRKSVLCFVKLHEIYTTRSEDGFNVQEHTRYRVLDIFEGKYRQRVYEDEKMVNEVFPIKNGKPMDYIPFYLTIGTSPKLSLLNDLADVNLAWYRKCADYESGLHYVSVPTPYTRGWTPPDTDENGNPVSEEKRQRIKLSSASFVNFPEGTEEVGMLEFSGAGMKSISDAMDEDEQRMAILGARIISSERKGVESAETATIHRASENSVLASFANSLSTAFDKATKDYLEWATGDNDIEVSIKVNTDYDTVGLQGNDIVALVNAWQQGAISRPVLFKNLQKGEIIDNSVTYDDMMAQLDEEGLLRSNIFAEDDTLNTIKLMPDINKMDKQIMDKQAKMKEVHEEY